MSECENCPDKSDCGDGCKEQAESKLQISSGFQTTSAQPPVDATTFVANCLGCGHGRASKIINRLGTDIEELKTHHEAGDLRRFLAGGK